MNSELVILNGNQIVEIKPKECYVPNEDIAIKW